jgi:hypothetical protein
MGAVLPPLSDNFSELRHGIRGQRQFFATIGNATTFP